MSSTIGASPSRSSACTLRAAGSRSLGRMLGSTRDTPQRRLVLAGGVRDSRASRPVRCVRPSRASSIDSVGAPQLSAPRLPERPGSRLRVRRISGGGSRADSPLDRRRDDPPHTVARPPRGARRRHDVRALSAQLGDPLYRIVDCGGNESPAATWDETYGARLDRLSHTVRRSHVRHAQGTDCVARRAGAPGALRSLHTQILQCSPTDELFYCGQAPADTRYRLDFTLARYLTTCDVLLADGRLQLLECFSESPRRAQLLLLATAGLSRLLTDLPGTTTPTSTAASSFSGTRHSASSAAISDASFLDDYATHRA